MGIFTILSLVITIISFIVKITSGGEKDDSPIYYVPNAPVDHFQESNLDGIVNCYDTFRVNKLNIYHLEHDLRNSHHERFNLLATKLSGNCLYLSVQFADVFDRKTKSGEVQEVHNDVVTYFSINYLEDSGSVIIYGCSSYNQRVKDNYKVIAGEIRKEIAI